MLARRARHKPDGLPIPKAPPRAGRIDKSVLAFGEPERIRDDAYTRSAQNRACECCGFMDGQSVVACHVNYGMGGGKLKAGDDQTLFLCTSCHSAMDTDPRGIPVWILENIVRPWMARRYMAWLSGGERAWRTLNAVAAIVVNTAVDMIRGRAFR